MTTNDTRLQHIQSLQFTDRPAAESLLLSFVRDTFPDLHPVAVELRPLAVSLNSFNGFLTLSDGSRLFFKTHVEPGSVIDEYYNSTLLAEAGYPVIQPRYASTEYGKQFLIYDVISSPSVFDVARAIESGERTDLGALTSAQNRSDDDLLQIYLHSLTAQSAADASKAAVHQLFHHRLGTRYSQFYGNQSIVLPGLTLPWESLIHRQWIINGIPYNGTLSSAINTACNVLEPATAGPAIVGHGDAHNGNVFFTGDNLIYFDPAFGGRHYPLLDLTKPLFHNVFATWMYHPQEVASAITLSLHDDGTTLHIDHNYQPSAVREMFFTSKVSRVLQPLILDLHRRSLLRPDWRTYLKSSLMCCPLLTMNLADPTRFPPAISLLGLCYAVEMSLESSSTETNRLNHTLNTVESELQLAP